MNLGTATLRKSGINTLTSAIHKKHGLVWSDGSVLYLINHEEESIKLGQFDVVESVHWSCDIEQSSSGADDQRLQTYSLLCVNHNTSLSIWKVSSDLQLKQVRRIHAAPITQGCLWNPTRDILCILNKDQCSFYFRHTQNKGNFSLPPIESGKIRCGCWLPDGNGLVIGIGTIVLIYRWEDITKSISHFTITAWKIPRVDGEVCSMTAVSPDRLLCASELPLSDTCIKYKQDLYDTPDLTKHRDESQLNLDNQNHDSLIKPSLLHTSHKDSIMNLKTNKLSYPDMHSELVLCDLSCEEKPKKLSSATIPGMMTPSLLTYDSEKKIIVASSNTQSALHIYKLNHEQVTRFHQIDLHNGDYPVGLSESLFNFLSPPTHDGGMLIMIGATTRESMFPSTCKHTEYQLQLQYINYTDGLLSDVHADPYSQSTHPPHKDLPLTGGDREVHLLRVNPLQQEQPKALVPSDYQYQPQEGVKLTTPHTPGIDLLLPNTVNALQHSAGKISVIGDDVMPGKELEICKTSFNDTPLSFRSRFELPAEKELSTETVVTNTSTSYNNAQSNGTLRKMGLKSLLMNRNKTQPSQQLQRSDKEVTFQLKSQVDCLSDHPEGSEQQSCIIEQLQHQVQLQAKQICDLQDKVEELSSKLECQFYDGHQYNNSSGPQTLTIVCETLDVSGPSETKTFMLDAGRLQLQPIKHAFNLVTVELMLDGIPCVLGNNADGYIPIRFDPNVTLHIRGRRAVHDKPRHAKRINSMIVTPTAKQHSNTVGMNGGMNGGMNDVKPISIHDLVAPTYTHTMPPDSFM